jgi:hypothetical protein
MLLVLSIPPGLAARLPDHLDLGDAGLHLTADFAVR